MDGSVGEQDEPVGRTTRMQDDDGSGEGVTASQLLQKRKKALLRAAQNHVICQAIHLIRGSLLPPKPNQFGDATSEEDVKGNACDCMVTDICRFSKSS